MIRYILIIIIFLVVYYAVKVVIRSAIGTYTNEERKSRLPGDEMVLDPECHTYIVKRRAVTRHIGGRLCFFCSEVCARQYEEKNRT
jgi:YHS domain-containing protein